MRRHAGAGEQHGFDTCHVPEHARVPAKRGTVLREYVEVCALWTQDEASYAGDFVCFGASWAWPKPAQAILGDGSVLDALPR